MTSSTKSADSGTVTRRIAMKKPFLSPFASRKSRQEQQGARTGSVPRGPRTLCGAALSSKNDPGLPFKHIGTKAGNAPQSYTTTTLSLPETQITQWRGERPMVQPLKPGRLHWRQAPILVTERIKRVGTKIARQPTR